MSDEVQQAVYSEPGVPAQPQGALFAWSGGMLSALVGDTVGYFATALPSLLQFEDAPLLFPISIKSSVRGLRLQVIENTLQADCDFTICRDGAPTAVTLKVPAKSVGAFALDPKIMETFADGAGLDLEAHVTDGGAGKITFSATVLL